MINEFLSNTSLVSEKMIDLILINHTNNHHVHDNDIVNGEKEMVRFDNDGKHIYAYYFHFA